MSSSWSASRKNAFRIKTFCDDALRLCKRGTNIGRCRILSGQILRAHSPLAAARDNINKIRGLERTDSSMRMTRCSPEASLMKIFFLILSYVSTAFCQSPWGDDIEDYTQSGKYFIVYCKAGVPRSHAAYLQQLVPFMQSNLQAVLNDVDRGTASPAYRAFFKTNNNLDNVRQVFTDIMNGSSLVAAGQTASPALVCTETDEPILNRIRGRCNNPAGTPAFTMQSSKVVFFCPSFWTMRRAARKAACPVIVNGEVETEPRQLRSTKFAVLVHELVHIYNKFDHTQDLFDNTEEVYNLTDVVGLNAVRSLENAQNFAYYAAGK